MEVKNRYNWLIKLILCGYLIIPFSCEKDDEVDPCSYDPCCGVSFKQQYSIIDSMSIQTGKTISNQGDDYEFNFFESLSSNSYDTAAIRIEVVKKKILSFEYKPKFNFSLMSTAYACSPAPALPTQRVSSIIIRSDKTIYDKDSSYKAGEDLSDFFEIVPEGINAEKMTFDEFINKQQDDLNLLGRYSPGLILKLNKHLTIPENKLTITMKFDDNSEHILSTEEFTID